MEQLAAEDFAYLLLALAGTLYAVLGGADFGAGIWETNLGFQATPKERALITRAMGPVWEANHVWLIFVVVLLFTCFPPAFAALTQALWLPLLVSVLGIVLRGTSFVLRAYTDDPVAARRWGIVFASSSALAPLGLGAAVGSIASGALPVDQNGVFSGSYFTSWIHPLSIFSALFAVAGSSYLAAVYLTRDALREEGGELVETWRRRALASGKWMGVMAIAGIGMLYTAAPQVFIPFADRAWLCVALSATGGILSYVSLWKRRFTLAVFCAALAVAGVVSGLATSQYPWLIPYGLSIENAKAEPAVLKLVVSVSAAGMLVLIPSLAYFLYIFKFAERTEEPLNYR